MNEEARPHRVYTVMRNLSIAFAVLVAGLILLYFLPTAWGRYCMAHIPTPAHLFFSIGVVCAMAMLVTVALGIVRPVRWEEPVDVMRWCLAGIGALLGTGMFAASVWLMYFSTFSCRTVTPRTFADSPPPTANARSEIAPCATICDVLCSITIVGPPTLNHIAVGPSYLPVRRSLASSYVTVPKQNDTSNSQRPMTVNTMPAAVRMIRLFMRRSFRLTGRGLGDRACCL